VSKQYINPPNLFQSQQYGFSQVVAAKGGTTLYFSGQVGWNESQVLANGNDLVAQTHAAFENLQRAVEAAGGQMRDVLSLRIYIVNHKPEGNLIISACLLKFFPADALPVTTWLGIQALAQPELLIEIEAVAVLEET